MHGLAGCVMLNLLGISKIILLPIGHREEHFALGFRESNKKENNEGTIPGSR